MRKVFFFGKVKAKLIPAYQTLYRRCYCRKFQQNRYSITGRTSLTPAGLRLKVKLMPKVGRYKIKKGQNKNSAPCKSNIL